MTGDSSPPSFDPRILADLAGLPLRARRIVEGFVAGGHRSPFHGHSVEFAEHREYVPGDDVRRVDWKVFGRTDKYYVRRYEDETNLIAYLLLDTSASMDYRGPAAPWSKLAYAQCLAAALAWLVLQRRDAVSLVLYDDQIRSRLPPSNAPAYWNEILQVLANVRPGPATRTGEILQEVAETTRKRGVVLVLSDLFDDPESLVTGLRRLRHQRHDIVLWQILDAAEADFPFQEAAWFRDLEGGERMAIDPGTLRRAYLREFAAHQATLRTMCRELEIEYRIARTEQPLDQALGWFLAERMARNP